MYLVNDSLTANKNSPLRKKLVDDLQLATRVSGYAYGRVMSGEYSLTIDLRPGVDPAEVIEIVNETISEYLDAGPDAQIVENTKLKMNMIMLGALETGASIGRMLAEGLLYSDDPLFINQELDWLNAATPDELRDIAKRWLTRGYYQITVLPFPDYTTAEADIDRSAIPAVAAKSSTNFPAIETATLSNGLQLVVATRGSFQDGLERSSFGYRILNGNLQASLLLAAEMLKNPSFPDEELTKLKAQIAAYLANLEVAPARAASGLFDRVIYGDENPMGSVWTPELLDRDKLVAFYKAEITPDNMTIYMIGDIGIEDARTAVERAFAKWNTRGNSARKPIGQAASAAAKVILVDYPGAESSTIVTGNAVAPYNPDTWTAASIMNRVIGGSFESRLNMNLRIAVS